jgi:hypothetical protein
MPVNSITYNFDDLLSSTWMNYRDKLYENIFNACPFFYWIHANGRKRTEDGGERIVIPLEYGKNDTIKSMTSGYDVVDTTPQEGITSAYFQWKEIAGSTTISNRELAINQGSHKIIDLLQQKANNTEMSMTEIVNAMMLAFSAGNGGHDLTPLFKLIQKTPTGSDTVGGINQSTYAWWQNQIKSSTATTWAGFIAEMLHLYLSCSKGGSKGKRSFPDQILCDMRYYEAYENACRAKGQIVMTNETVADLGFGGLKFKGATLMWDEYVPSVNDEVAITVDTVDTYWSSYSKSTAAFINSEFIELVVMKGQDFTIGPFIQPENQKAKTSLIYLMGEMCCSNRRKQGVHYNVSQSITA